MPKKVFSLLLFIQCLVLAAFGICYGGRLCEISKENILLKGYNSILRIYTPAICEIQKESGILTDFAKGLFPALSYTQEIAWCDSQKEQREDYEYLAEIENEQLGRLLAENDRAAGKQGETAEEEEEAGMETVAGEQNGSILLDGTRKAVEINRKKLNDFDYLRQNFYQIDNTTTIGSEQLDAEKLLAMDMTIDTKGEEPQILIYHTHSQEGFSDTKAGDASMTVVGLGDTLTELLEKKYGFVVLHHKGEYDVGDRDHAYSNAAPAVETLLKEHPSIQVVIDLHRDGVAETTHLVTDLNGKQTAQIMFFNGLSRTTTQGNITSLKNLYINENLAFSLQLELAAKEYYPNLTRRIYLKGYRYNMHFCPKSLLVEVGAQTNTYEEAENAMEPLADLLAKVLT